MTDVQLKDGDCLECDGCGYLADGSDGTPWRAWLALPLNASAAVLAGLVKPEKCTLCGGTGDKPQVAYLDQKAVLAFGCSNQDVAVVWATDGVSRKMAVAGISARDFFEHWPQIDHGIWVWEGEIKPVAHRSGHTTDYDVDFVGKLRLPTDEEWSAIRQNLDPFWDAEVLRGTVLTDEMKAKGRWWVSWWGKVGFNLHMPWWITGGSEGEDRCICAAILANSVEEARAAVIGAHDDNGAGISEWRFVEPRAVDWQPFCDRFPRADWMQWPAEYER